VQRRQPGTFSDRVEKGIAALSEMLEAFPHHPQVFLPAKCKSSTYPLTLLTLSDLLLRSPTWDPAQGCHPSQKPGPLKSGSRQAANDQPEHCIPAVFVHYSAPCLGRMLFAMACPVASADQSTFPTNLVIWPPCRTTGCRNVWRICGASSRRWWS